MVETQMEIRYVGSKYQSINIMENIAYGLFIVTIRGEYFYE